MRSLRILVMVALLATVAGTACEDDSGGSAEEDDTEELTGDPIRLMTIATISVGEGFDEVPGGAEAAAEAINQAGGVNGSPIEIISCDEMQDPNGTADCGRRAVDENVDAVVGAFTADGDQYIPIIAAEGIPTIANYAIGFGDFGNEYSFPIMGGSPAALGGMAALQPDLNDADTVNVTFLEIGAGEIAVDFAETALEARDLEVSSQTPYPPDTTDANPIVAAAIADDPDSIVLALTTEDTAQFIQAAAQAAVDPATMVASGSSVNDMTIEQLGPAVEGVYVVSSFKPVNSDDPAVVEFREEMDAYDSELDQNDTSMNAWAGVHLIADVAKDLDKVNSKTLFEAMNRLREVDLGVVAPFSFQKPDNRILPGVITRIFNPKVIYLQIEDGELTEVTGEFVDPFNPPSGN
jgi:ABC-type branched-subunit amino acid transport system substrate-binding protein